MPQTNARTMPLTAIHVTVRRLLLLPPQTQADIGGAAVPQQQRHGVDQNGHRKGHVDRRHAGDAHALPHEDLIDDAVKIVDHQGQRRRNGIAEQEPGQRLRLQRAAVFLHGLHGHVLPSFCYACASSFTALSAVQNMITSIVRRRRHFRKNVSPGTAGSVECAQLIRLKMLMCAWPASGIRWAEYRCSF